MGAGRSRLTDRHVEKIGAMSDDLDGRMEVVVRYSGGQKKRVVKVKRNGTIQDLKGVIAETMGFRRRCRSCIWKGGRSRETGTD